tara:strand:- start:116 stop:439 length:324 start_codon:yes stop_codon:yes gene_type:complete
MGHEVEENKVLVINNPSHAEEHPEFHADVAIRNDIGFRWNENRETYELVAELDTWDLDVPVERFIDKLTQQYAKATLLATSEEEGFVLEKETSNIDNTIEMVVTRWR